MPLPLKSVPTCIATTSGTRLSFANSIARPSASLFAHRLSRSHQYTTGPALALALALARARADASNAAFAASFIPRHRRASTPSRAPRVVVAVAVVVVAPRAPVVAPARRRASARASRARAPCARTASRIARDAIARRLARGAVAL
jgi:hypothetical protein